jgi:hypothetical protein
VYLYHVLLFIAINIYDIDCKKVLLNFIGLTRLSLLKFNQTAHVRPTKIKWVSHIKPIISVK